MTNIIVGMTLNKAPHIINPLLSLPIEKKYEYTITSWETQNKKIFISLNEEKTAS